MLRPVLFRAYGGDAERVHEQTLAVDRPGSGRHRPALRGVAAGCAPGTGTRSRWPASSSRAWSGWRPGWTRTASALRAWAALGFGHAELGTVTAQAQPGNDRPRLFRLPRSRAMINRMGFNNRAAAALAERLAAAGVARGNRAVGIPLGISIGKTKITPLAEAAEDYLTSLRLLARYADYLAVNVSSPNTPGLRSLQDADAARRAGRRAGRRGRAPRRAAGPPVPIFVKLAPDLTEDALEEAARRSAPRPAPRD